MTAGTLPLDGIRVVEFSHTIMGPTCGVVLADLGASVVKIEPPGGDPTRALRGYGTGFFAYFNRNKESVVLDLKSAEGLELARRLVDEADVLVENFAPETMDRLGLGYDELAARNPRLIYCALKGFLPGPYEHRVALDEVVQMMSGLAHMTGPPGRPLRAGASVVDILGGTFGVVAILAAVVERERTGRGQRVTSALFETAAFLVGQHMAHAATAPERIPPMSTRTSAWAIYDLFRTADARPVFIGITTDRIWTDFCAAFARPDLASDARLQTNNDRLDARPWLKPEIETIVAGLAYEIVAERCERARVPFAPVAHPDELFDDPHLVASGQLAATNIPNGPTASLPKLPLLMDGRRMHLRAQPPTLGDATDRTLARLVDAGRKTLDRI